MYINTKSQGWKLYAAAAHILGAPLAAGLVVYRLYLKFTLWLFFGIPVTGNYSIKVSVCNIQLAHLGGGYGAKTGISEKYSGGEPCDQKRGSSV